MKDDFSLPKNRILWSHRFVAVNILLWLGLAMGSSGEARAASSQAAQSASQERAFIANAGGDFGVDDAPVTDGNPADAAFNEFYAAMKDWGRYEMVDNPARADWVFEISVKNDQTCTLDYEGRPRGAVEILHNRYLITLVVLNTHDKTLGKKYVEDIKDPGLFHDPQKMFDQAIAALLDDAKGQAGEPAGKTPLPRHGGAIAPLAPEIASASKVFIEDIGSRDPRAEQYSGGRSQVYDLLSADIRSWGKYELAPSAAQADLVLRVSFSINPRRPPCSSSDPQINLGVFDARNDALLRGINVHVSQGLLASTTHKNFQQGMAELVFDLRNMEQGIPWTTLEDAMAAMDKTNSKANSQGGDPVSNAAPIPITIRAPAGAVKSGSDLQVEVTVKNTSHKKLDFAYPAHDPLTCGVVVRDSSGNMASDTKQGSTFKSIHAVLRGDLVTYTLNPGEAQTRQCDVSTLYDLKPRGKYSIQVEQLDGRAVKSNAINIVVTP